ncbi:MAG: NADPH:quinone reductase [Fimbriiglobus sp.]
MKAVYFSQTGEPEVLTQGDYPTPEPQSGEVLVRVKTAAINPVDTYIRAGLVNMPLKFPAITGSDFAGVVEAIGDGVTRFRVGDRVWGSNQGMLGRPGTFAEYVCPHEDYTYPTPTNAEDRTMAALALVGITAHLGLYFRVNLKAGETVFVHGGTGGVGSCVVQMAKATGAKVITTVSSAEKAELAKQLGADIVLNYKTDDLVAGVKEATAGKGVDVFYETQPPTDFDKTVEMMAPYGRVVVMAGRGARPVFPNGPFYVKGLSLYGFAMFNLPPAEQRKCADDINRLVANGQLKALLGPEFSLAEGIEAHRLQQTNTLGKVGTLSGKITIRV